MAQLNVDRWKGLERGLTSVAQWFERGPMHQRVAGLFLARAWVLGLLCLLVMGVCARGRQQSVSFSHRYFPPSLPISLPPSLSERQWKSFGVY